MICDKNRVTISCNYVGIAFIISLSLSLSLSLSDAASETSEVASTELPTLTESQIKELDKTYISGQYQDAAVLRELAHRLELTDNQIQVRLCILTLDIYIHVSDAVTYLYINMCFYKVMKWYFIA